MVFGCNELSIQHEQTGWGLTFHALEALKSMKEYKDPQSIEVAYAAHWKQKR
jgi:hypothetical protein